MRPTKSWMASGMSVLPTCPTGLRRSSPRGRGCGSTSTASPTPFTGSWRCRSPTGLGRGRLCGTFSTPTVRTRSEEHTSELQSRPHLVCRLLLEKKKKTDINRQSIPTILYHHHQSLLTSTSSCLLLTYSIFHHTPLF